MELMALPMLSDEPFEQREAAAALELTETDAEGAG